MCSSGKAPLPFPAAPATPELFLPGRRVWLLACSRLHAARGLQARKTRSFPQQGLRGGADSPRCTHTTRKVLHPRVRSLLILRSPKTTLTPDEIKSGKETKRKAAQCRAAKSRISRPRCRPWFSFPEERVSRGAARRRTLSLSLPCIALAAHGSGLLPARSAGAGQVTARSEKRKRKRVIHPSALPHLQSHAAFTHSLPSPINSFG